MGIRIFSRHTCADIWFCTELLLVLPTFSTSSILSAFYQFENSHSQTETSLGSFHHLLAAGRHGNVSLRGAVLHVPVLRGTCQPCLGCGSCQSHPAGGLEMPLEHLKGHSPAGCVSLHPQSLLTQLPQISGRSMIHRPKAGRPAVGTLIVKWIKTLIIHEWWVLWLCPKGLACREKASYTQQDH